MHISHAHVTGPVVVSNRHVSVADAGQGLARSGSVDASAAAEMAALKARVKELEMEQSLMQRELDNMSEVAQRTDTQLRYAAADS